MNWVILAIFIILIFLSILVIYFLLKKLQKINNEYNEQSRSLTAIQTRYDETQRIIEEKKNLEKEGEEELNRLRLKLEERKEYSARLETKLEEAKKNIEEQRKLLKQATQELSDTFSSLSAKALKDNNEQFLKLAKQNLQTVLEKTKNEFGKEAIENTLKPLKDTLKRYDQEIKQMEKNRQSAYGGLKEQLKNLSSTHEKLNEKTAALVNALKRPHVRGRWGEITLKRVVELVGMSEYCDFTEQSSVKTEEGILRPDLIVHLPGKRTIVVDAKAPLKFFLNANEAKSERERESAIEAHAKAVRNHMKKLSRKDYWNQFPESPDYVVLFLPGDSFFNAALELDKDLMEDSINNRVLITTPSTLIALLRTVALSWQQQKITDNAKKIADVGAEMYDRICKFQEHLEKMGKNLDMTVDNYNKAVGSFSSRLIPGAKKLEELGAKQTKKGAKEIETIETPIRKLTDK